MTVVSKSQQRLMGVVDAYKKGELELSSLPQSLADKVEDFASTKHKGLSEKVKEESLEEDKEQLSKAKVKHEDISSKYTSGKTLAKLEVGQEAKINLKKLGLTEGIKVKNVGEAKSLLRKNNIKVTSSKYTTGEQGEILTNNDTEARSLLRSMGLFLNEESLEEDKKQLSKVKVKHGKMHELLGIKPGEDISSKYTSGKTLAHALEDKVGKEKALHMLNYAANMSNDSLFKTAVRELEEKKVLKEFDVLPKLSIGQEVKINLKGVDLTVTITNIANNLVAFKGEDTSGRKHSGVAPLKEFAEMMSESTLNESEAKHVEKMKPVVIQKTNPSFSKIEDKFKNKKQNFDETRVYPFKKIEFYQSGKLIPEMTQKFRDSKQYLDLVKCIFGEATFRKANNILFEMKEKSIMIALLTEKLKRVTGKTFRLTEDETINPIVPDEVNVSPEEQAKLKEKELRRLITKFQTEQDKLATQLKPFEEQIALINQQIKAIQGETPKQLMLYKGEIEKLMNELNKEMFVVTATVGKVVARIDESKGRATPSYKSVVEGIKAFENFMDTYKDLYEDLWEKNKGVAEIKKTLSIKKEGLMMESRLGDLFNILLNVFKSLRSKFTRTINSAKQLELSLKNILT